MDEDEELFTETETKGIYLIQLPDGCDEGRWESAHEFAHRITALRQHLGRPITVVPFSYSGKAGGFKGSYNHGPVKLGVTAYLAFAT